MNQDPFLSVKWPQRLHSSVRSTFRSLVESVTPRLLLLDWERANGFLSIVGPNTPGLQANKPWDDFMQKSALRG
jgi:hypothetical protein